MTAFQNPDSVRDQRAHARDSLIRLIDKLSIATVGSRQLDESIGFVFGEVPETTKPWSSMRVAPAVYIRLDDHDARFLQHKELPLYTTSLDAAVTKLPEECRWTVEGSGRIYGASVEVKLPSRIVLAEPELVHAVALAAKPALALMIAILQVMVKLLHRASDEVLLEQGIAVALLAAAREGK